MKEPRIEARSKVCCSRPPRNDRGSRAVHIRTLSASTKTLSQALRVPTLSQALRVPSLFLSRKYRLKLLFENGVIVAWGISSCGAIFRRGSRSCLFPEVHYRRWRQILWCLYVPCFCRTWDTAWEHVSWAPRATFRTKAVPSKYSRVLALISILLRHESNPPIPPPTIHRASKVQRAVAYVIQEAGFAAKGYNSYIEISCRVPGGH